jgi:putative oxidoreductase
MSLATGLLIIRIVIGLYMIGHGSQKLFGWFSGPGFKGTSGWLGSMNFTPSWFWALLAGLGELGGGLLFAVGFLTPLGAIGIFAAMLMALIKIHLPNGLWVDKGGIEYPFVLVIISLVVGLFGPGAYSIDASIGLNIPMALIIIGFILAVIVDLIGNAISNSKSTQEKVA